MKPFYVRHKSREEAIEVIDRAVANGANKYEGVEQHHAWGYHTPSDYSLIGVDYEDDTIFYDLPENYGYDSEELTIEQVREMYPLPNEKVSDEVGARKFKLWDKVEYEVESVEYEGVVVGYDHDFYVVKTQYEDMTSDYYEQFDEESLTLVTNPLDMITQILYNTQGIENQAQEILKYMEENK